MLKSLSNSKKMNRREFLSNSAFAGIYLGFLPSLLTLGCKQRKRTPNIIFISIDTLRADHLGCYGYPHQTTSNIDKLSENALLFENCIAHSPSTITSFASIFSGFYPGETKVADQYKLQKGYQVLPELLQKIGYNSYAVVGNYTLLKEYNWDRGYKIYDDNMDEFEIVRNVKERTAANTTKAAIKILDSINDDPFFLWLHYQDPHGPYTPPQKFIKETASANDKSIHLPLKDNLSGLNGIPSYQKLGNHDELHYYQSRYDGEIRYADEQVGIIIEKLKKLNVYDDSLIIFTSDHGENLGEHNYYFCHSENLYQGLIHVPLIIKHGDALSGRESTFVQHIDLLPTILNFVGHPQDKRLRGTDLLSSKIEEKAIFSEMVLPDAWKKWNYTSAYTLIKDSLKLMFIPDDNSFQLFDLKNDSGEKINLVHQKKYSKQFKKLSILLDKTRKEDFLKVGQKKADIQISEEKLKRLKSLGYTR